ncbi:MAG: hypothetical protein RLZZ15_814 [Verrucomicrobiota bacterium]|jgi:exosortase
MSPAPAVAAPLAGSHRITQVAVALLAGVLVALGWRLWPEWRHNPDLSHGLFMPVVFLWLVHESRTTGTRRFLPAGAARATALGVLLVAGLLALGAVGLYAAALDWSHPLVVFTLAVAAALFLGAGLVTLAADEVRLVPLNWPALVAIGLWLLSTPFPPGAYTRLTLALQLAVSENSVAVLHALGVVAVRHGNIIELANATVGVEEACSGVRSLLSCVFAGFLFSATLVRRPARRALILALAAPLALVMNFLRSLGLTLLANSGVDIAGAWHDATGFAVLGVTAVLLGGLALLLERGEKKSLESPAEIPPAAPASAMPPPASTSTTPPFSPPPAAPRLQPSAFSLQPFLLAATLTVAAGLAVFFALNTRSSVRRDAPVPDLAALLPAAADGWEVAAQSNLFEFRSLLRTEHLAQRVYTKTDAAEPTFIIVYLAYWRAGQVPVSLVASHTPDGCWPGSGWNAQPVPDPRLRAVVAARPLAPGEYRYFKLGDLPQHVWFWHLYDGRPIPYRDPYSPAELLRIAWRYGFRHDGDQLFVRVSSNRPWPEIAGAPVLEKFFANTRPLGL